MRTPDASPTCLDTLTVRTLRKSLPSRCTLFETLPLRRTPLFASGDTERARRKGKLSATGMPSATDADDSDADRTSRSFEDAIATEEASDEMTERDANAQREPNLEWFGLGDLPKAPPRS